MSLKFNNKNEVVEWLRNYPSQGMAHLLLARMWIMANICSEIYILFQPFETLEKGFQWLAEYPDDDKILLYAKIAHDETLREVGSQ